MFEYTRILSCMAPTGADGARTVNRAVLRVIRVLPQSVYFLLRRAVEARRCSIESTQSSVIPDLHEESL
jgi:hypothetical protein